MTNDIKTAVDRIVEKYKPYMYCYMGSGMLSNDYDDNVATRNAITCAIIEVEACIELLNSMSPEFFHHTRNRLNLTLTELKSRIV